MRLNLILHDPKAVFKPILFSVKELHISFTLGLFLANVQIADLVERHHIFFTEKHVNEYIYNKAQMLLPYAF